MLGMNCYNAAKAAGYSEEYAQSASCRIEPRAGIADIFDQAGATDKALAEKLAQIAFTATKIQNVNIVLKKNAEGKLEVQDADDFIEVPDYNSQLQAIRQISELKKRIGSKGDGSDSTPIETYLIEFVKKYNGNLREQGIDGLKIVRTEHRALDKFLAK
jgi:hypothetical protein